ncbi:MAG: hypothetical protein DLM50_02515 [Candidatus Meridianibacter frigidus]|nr:MAG: hypothetical protein DLM50_02515 [Candidatus Eremiobacteraeota bacterium]
MSFRDEKPKHRRFDLPGAFPRYGPDKLVDVVHIDLYLEPDLPARTLSGICTTTVRGLDEPVSRLELDAVDLEVSSVARQSAALPFECHDQKLGITFDPPIAAGETVDFAITYRAVNPRHGLFFVAPSPEYPNLVPHVWTQSQDENARYWFPCFDYPHEKQTTSATIVVPQGMFALSNGALTARDDRDGKTVFRYEQNVPHSTYLVSMVAGPFVETQQRSGPCPVFYYVLPGRQADGERSFGKTPQMIDVFEEKIATKYPYARYSQIAVSDFIFGGMENTAATTQTDRTLHDERAHADFSSDPLVAHELAHQWFGDLLTCRDWAHAWLNEGFATFFEAIFREANLGYDEYLFDVFEFMARYVDEDQSRYRRPIVYNTFRDPIELFDRHLYEKGGAVLHMLRGELGEQRFWRSIVHYVKQNAGRSVETIDFIRAIEESTGRNMREFFDQWVFRGGHPQIEVSARYDKKRGALTVTIEQKQHIDEENPPHRFDVELGLCEQAEDGARQDFGSGALPDEQRIRISIQRAREIVYVPLDAEPKLVRFDPGAFLLADITYKLGDTLARAALAADPSPVARIRAARELAGEGGRAAREALAQCFEREAFWGVLAKAAEALGHTRAPWAREMLSAHAGHKHPKVRRAIAAALGNFQSEEAAAVLIPLAREDHSYFVQASALHALGKTRDPRAIDVLSQAIETHSWNGIIESGAARGFGELGDPRALQTLLRASETGKEEGLRRAALDAMARMGELVDERRTAAVEAIMRTLEDRMLLVQLAALAAAEHLSDARFLPTLDRLSHSAFDGRVRRDATEAAIRIRESQHVPAQVAGLRSDVDTLREEYRKLQAKLDELTPHT